jgi:hypothetical protein
MARSKLMSWGLWICLLVFMVVGSARYRFSSSFHDLGGGRLPMSDGAAWFVGSAQATEGGRLGWVARRPLNVSFNAPLIRLSARVAADPLLMTLQLKRALAFAAIAALVVALEGCCSQLARLGIGLSLLASLFSSKASSLSFLIGSGVGYTHGTELNAFVFVVSAVACLVAWTRTRRLEQQKRSLLFLGSGLFLLSVGCNIRPGTLLLLPLLIGLAAMAETRTLGQAFWPPTLMALKGLRPFLLAVGLGIGSCLLLQQLAFAQVTDECGAIGGNQGLTLYGLSRGLDWNAGVAYQKIHAPGCEKTANILLKKEALRTFVRDPLPALGVVMDNFDNNNRIASTAIFRSGRRSWPVFLLAVMAMTNLLWRHRFPENGGLIGTGNLVFLIGFLGWLSMELFMLFLFRDSYLRPLAPYAVFPILVVWWLIDRVLARSAMPCNRNGPAPAILLLLPGCLSIHLLLGNLTLLIGGPLATLGFPTVVKGSFPVEISRLRSMGTDQWMFNLGLPSNYSLSRPIPDELSAPGDRPDGVYCLSYERRRTLDSFDLYGKIALEPGACRG